jgi:decaprenylphospho-beta-D-ribofuranose 2-oxidase
MKSVKSFDRTEESNVQMMRPDRFRQLFDNLSNPNVIPRGAGLNYCLASALSGGSSVLTSQFNRFIDFDTNKKIIRVEPGVTIAELFEFAITNNLMLPVLPGYPEITVGGALAMNVHGKNQYRRGNFGDHVKRISIYHPRYGELICSPEENPDIYYLTIGGFGLTGFMLTIDIQLEILQGRSVNVERHNVANLIDATSMMESMADKSDFLYSWHDLNNKGKNFGRGVVYKETFNGEGVIKNKIKPNKFLNRMMPLSLYNKLTVPMFCKAFNAKEYLLPSQNKASLYQASFPIVGKEIYFSLFGRQGFREYQILLPRESWNNAVKQIESEIKSAGIVITLASLKLFKGGRQMLNFVGDGVCLAIDTPNNLQSISFFARLDDLAVRLGGLGNISKDSRLSSNVLQRMYKAGYEDFKNGLHKYDPNRHFQSDLSKRLNV